MKKAFFVIYLMIFLWSCGDNQDNVNEIKSGHSQIYYFKDDRTNICFGAISSVHSSTFSFTEVPCEKIPENLLVQ